MAAAPPPGTVLGLERRTAWRKTAALAVLGALAGTFGPELRQAGFVSPPGCRTRPSVRSGSSARRAEAVVDSVDVDKETQEGTTYSEFLKVSKNTEIGELGYAMFCSLMSKGCITVRCVGADNANVAVRAVNVANKWMTKVLGNDTSAMDKRLAVLPEFVTFQPSGTNREGNALSLTVELMNQPPFDPDEFAEENILLSKADAKGVFMRATILKRIHERNGVVKVSSLGAQSVYNALKSLLFANRFLRSEGSQTVLAGFPRLEEFTFDEETGEKSTRSVLIVAPQSMASP